MKKILFITILILSIASYAQEDSIKNSFVKPRVHMHLTLQVDPFFGFLPICGAIIKTKSWFGYTAYTKIWASSHFASQNKYELLDVNGKPTEVKVYTNDGSLTEIG